MIQQALSAIGTSRRGRLVYVPPAGGGLPAWMSGTPSLNTWYELAGTRIDSAQNGFTSPGGQKQYVCAYSGMAVKNSGSELWIYGGGHNDYAGNEPYTLRLQNDSPAWLRRRDPTASVNNSGVSHQSDGRPTSRHTYWHLQFINSLNRMVTVGGAAYYEPSGGTSFPSVDAFNPDTNDWLAANTYASGPSGFQSVGQAMCKDSSENVWVQNPNGSGDLYRWNAATQTWTTIGSRSTYNYDAPLAHDSTRNRLVRFSESGLARTFDLNNNAAEASISFTGSQAAQAGRSCSVVYVSDIDRFLIMPWDTNNIYECHPTTWAVELYNVSGTKPPAPSADGIGNLYGRFNICPELKLIVYVRSVSDNVWIFRYGSV